MKRKTNEQFVKELFDVNSTLIPLDEYTTSRKKIEVLCSVCGHKFYNKPAILLLGIGCPYCSHCMLKTHETYVEEMKNIHPTITVIGEYVNSKTKVELHCDVCGNNWSSTPNSSLKGRGCPYCYGHLRRTHEQFLSEMNNVHPDILVIGDYINNNTKVECQCMKCGTHFSSTPHSMIGGQNSGCPVCRISKGEMRIAKYLADKGIEYVPQKTFEGLSGTGGHKLLYDFFLPQHNTLIEFQGIQHELPRDFGGRGESYSEKAFDKQQEHDKRKREYAISNGYRLIEIWHYDFENIEEILNKELNIELVS